ncbi:autotransporter outer membrane beta-barrel domain-containing protein [Parasutterella secunda]|uniref:Autotransporter outer membrane beta-barrel domain-containing protein n=1 Tax=Parasutterella secunda TaxID=626947 RepID=A0ABS2GU30_9BURK|nr:autotransporter outer membrane beta-barrel domain-containing protein [Parasutterella secunda]MBM6928316.1 autotransporter outer membrane beta-barrel domain-containing protein [Parasutterella secunda]
MNKVYKSIWNAVTRSWTAVSEIQHTHPKNLKTSLFIVTLLSFISTPSFSAYMFNQDAVVDAPLGRFDDIIVIQDSNVVFGQGLFISPQGIQFRDDSENPGTPSLTVYGTDQLGSNVSFYSNNPALGNFNTYTKLTINKNNVADNWDFGSVKFETLQVGGGDGTFSSDSVIVAQGNGSDTEKFIIQNSNEQWQDYRGWLRISNTNLDLDLSQDSIFGQVGLSVGSGGVVFANERYMTIDRFGWSRDSQGRGILDLTNVDPLDSAYDRSDPFLHVNTLWMEGDGQIRLDLSHYLIPGSVMTRDSILDYQRDNRDENFWVLTANAIYGNGKIDIVDESGNIISENVENPSIENVDFFNWGNPNNLAATGVWGYIAHFNQVDDPNNDEDKIGVYVDYELMSLELKGTNQWDHSIKINLVDATKRDLYIPVSGTGIIDIDSSTTDNKYLTISNINNTFSGLVNVGSGTILEVLSGALGGVDADGKLTQIGTSLVLRDKSTFNLIDQFNGVTATSPQVLTAIQLFGSSSVNLYQGTELDLHLGTESSSYLVNETDKNQFGDKQLIGEGNLTLSSGELLFTSSSTLFENYSGDLTVKKDSTMLFSDKEGAQSFVLKKLFGDGTAELATDTIVGDLSDFTGQLLIQDSQSLTLADSATTQLNIHDPLEINTLTNSSVLIFDSFTQFDNGSITQNLNLDQKIENYQFINTNGFFNVSAAKNLTLKGSNIERNGLTELDNSTFIDNASALYYSNFKGKASVNLNNISGEGTLGIYFSSPSQLRVDSVATGNAFTLKFENAKFEVGNSHIGDENNKVNNLFVGSDSTLVLHGAKQMLGDLTLSDGSSLDFTIDNGFNLSGESVNVLDMNGNKIKTSVDEVSVWVKVDPSVDVSSPDLNQSLMQVVRDENNSGSDLILIKNIDITDTSIEKIASTLTPQGELKTATVTYVVDQTNIADITTGVGKGWGTEDDGQGYIGLRYNDVQQVAIYDQQVAQFEATGSDERDTILTKLSDKDPNSKGSVHFYGNGTVYLNSSYGANDYSGSTTIDGGVTVNAISEKSLGDSEIVQVGTESSEGNLGIAAVQDIGALRVTDKSTVSLGEKANVNIKGTSESVINGTLSGTGSLTLAGGVATFNHSDLFNEFSGQFNVLNDAKMTFVGQNQLTRILGDGEVSISNTTQSVALKDLSGFAGQLHVQDNTVLRFDTETDLQDGDIKLTLTGSQTGNKVVFDQFMTDTSGVIDNGLVITNIDQFDFNGMNGVFQNSGKLDLNLKNSTIIRTSRSELDNITKLDSKSTLNYQFVKGVSGKQSLAGVNGAGSLGLEFNEVVDLSLMDGEDFNGQLRFVNAVLEVGQNHTQNDSNSILAAKNALFVDTGSTLVMKGEQTLGHNLTLGSGSALDFSLNDGEMVTNGTADNALHLADKDIVLSDSGENVQVFVNVDPSINIQEADTTGSLMEAVRVQDDANLSLILIDGIGNDAKDVASHMQLTQNRDAQSAVVTYHDLSGNTVADISTGVGLAGDEHGNIGLMYGKVTQVAIYGGQTAVFNATGDVNGDLISAKITNRDEEAGSAHFTGKGTIELTNSSNDYSGATTIDGEATVIASASNALGRSTNVIVGSDTQGTLVVNADQEHLGGLQVKDTGSLSVAEDKVFTINNSHDSNITGELSGKGKISLVNSELTYTNDVEKTLSVAFETQDYDSSFIKKGQGKLDFEQQLTNLNLSLQEGSLVLDNGDSLTGLEVSQGTSIDVNGLVNLEVLVGTGATFNMALDFGSGSQDELVDGKPGLNIGNGTGSHFLNVTSKDLNKGAEESIKVVHMDSGNATFALSGGKEAITSGGYDYLLKSSEVPDGGMEYFLSSIAGDKPVDPTEPTRNVTVTAGSYIGIAYAAQLFDLSLHDRVGNRDWINPITGEKQTTSLWMHHTMSHERFRDSTAQLRMRTTSNTTMLGGDLVQFTTGDTGLAYAGLMGGYGSMDTKSRSKVTGSHSKADTEAWGVGAYAGWKANSDGQTGPYVDGWVMFTHANSDVTGVSQHTEDVKGQGLSASLEAGWGFKVGSVATANGKIANFTIEPHASVTWFGMQYDEIHNDAQDVKFEGENNVRTRLGARAILTQEGNNDFNAFVEANWVHNTQEYGATISGLTVDQAGSRNQGEGRIGVDWRVTDSLSVWGRVGASFGSDNYNEREGSIGVRYQF